MPRNTPAAARVSRRSLPLVLRFLCAVALLAGTGAAHAQAWPAHQIRLVVPFAAGGSTDITARVVADGMRPLLGQTVVVDNKPGAGGNIGAVQVAKAEADGYTLLMATSTHATNVSLYANPGYDFAQDLAPVTQVSLIPNLLVVGPACRRTTWPSSSPT